MLASSRYAADTLERLPEAVQWLADDAELAPRTPEALRAEMLATIGRHTTDENKVTAARYVRRREVTRSALSDILEQIDPARAVAITDAADVAVIGALEIARGRVRQQWQLADEQPDPALFGVIAWQSAVYGADLRQSGEVSLTLQIALRFFPMRCRTCLRLAKAHQGQPRVLLS